jgi:Putative DNA-binding domain
MSAWWVPKSAAELEDALQNQTVTESIYLDFKSLRAGNNKDSKGLAKDFASMSHLGGVLIFGVEEQKPAAEGPSIFTRAPGDLSGLRERMSQIASTRVQPPVFLETTELYRDDDTGYLVVVVPASSAAPHMVDGAYYARNDSTNRQMSDVEVRTLHIQNDLRREKYEGLLDREALRDPSPSDEREHGRMFVVAQPVSANMGLLQKTLYPGNIVDWLRQLDPVRTSPIRYSPSLLDGTDFYIRANGVSRSSYLVTKERQAGAGLAGTTQEVVSRMVDLEVQEDGGLRLFHGKSTYSKSDELPKVFLTSAIAGEVAAVIQYAREVSAVTSFSGPWHLGVLMVGLRTSPVFHRWDSDARSYNEDEYRQSIEATHAEMNAPGAPLLEKLLGRFFRSIEITGNLQTLDPFLIMEI